MKSLLIDCCVSVIAILTISTAIAEEQIFPGLYEPDHLVPLVPDAPRHDRYNDALQTQLKLNATFFTRMILLPSFEGESCLRLHGNDGDTDISKSSKFFLTYYLADKNIWQSMSENSDEKKQSEVTVEVSSAPISKGFALRLHAIWDQMLARTKPPEKVNTGLDGETIEFATSKGSGKTWSPMERRSPRLFVELGQSLIEYCKAKPENRGRVMQSVEEHATSLENYLKAHPVK